MMKNNEKSSQKERIMISLPTNLVQNIELYGTGRGLTKSIIIQLAVEKFLKEGAKANE